MAWSPCGCGSPPFTCQHCTGDRPETIQIDVPTSWTDLFIWCPSGFCSDLGGTYVLTAPSQDECVWSLLANPIPSDCGFVQTWFRLNPSGFFKGQFIFQERAGGGGLLRTAVTVWSGTVSNDCESWSGESLDHTPDSISTRTDACDGLDSSHILVTSL